MKFLGLHSKYYILGDLVVLEILRSVVKVPVGLHLVRVLLLVYYTTDRNISKSLLFICLVEKSRASLCVMS